MHLQQGKVAKRLLKILCVPQNVVDTSSVLASLVMPGPDSSKKTTETNLMDKAANFQQTVNCAADWMEELKWWSLLTAARIEGRYGAILSLVHPQVHMLLAH